MLASPPADVAPLCPPVVQVKPVKSLKVLCMERILSCGDFSAKVVVTYKDRVVADLCDFTRGQQNQLFPPIREEDL